MSGQKRDYGDGGIEQIEDDLVALLLAEREKHRRIIASVPDGAAVDPSLVKLPNDALMFPNPRAPGEGFSFTALRNPDNVTKEMGRHARCLGFAGPRPLHDIRSSRETALLDRGAAVHLVAARCGHDPAVLLRWYAKRTAKADAKAAEVIGTLSKGARVIWLQIGPERRHVAKAFTSELSLTR